MKEAKKLTGGLSSPGKMPCRSFSLPALTTCPVGRVLAKQENTSCSDCYALKGRYYFFNVKAALKYRLGAVQRALRSKVGRKRWIEAMVTQISEQSHDYFRWHDSGDIFSEPYLMLMVEVIRATPDTKHWIPTKEFNLIQKHWVLLESLSNATFRYSTGALAETRDQLSPGPDGPPIAHVQSVEGYGTAASITRVAQSGALLCLAAARAKLGKEQACGDCRACWMPSVRAIVYNLH